MSKKIIRTINTIPTFVDVQYVKNFGEKSCLNCIYLVTSSNTNLSFSHCAKFGEQNLVTGKIELSYASIMRKQYGPCGINAKYKKEKNNHTLLMVPIDKNTI